MLKIYIDPGHGGKDPGAVGNGLEEKAVNLEIANILEHFLKQFKGVDVRLSRRDDTYKTLKQRTDDANKWGADFFFSIHVNAGGGQGYEDYIHSSLSNTGETNQIRKVIHETVAEHMVEWRNRGMKKANFHVLRESKMPAMLVECGFIDNYHDAQLLKDPKFINDIAEVFAEGIRRAFDLEFKSINQKIYRVQVGAFREKENAERLANELKSKGYDVWVREG